MSGKPARQRRRPRAAAIALGLIPAALLAQNPDDPEWLDRELEKGIGPPHMPEELREKADKVIVVSGRGVAEQDVDGTYGRSTPGLVGGMDRGSRMGTITKEVGGVPIYFPIPGTALPGAILGGIIGLSQREIQAFRDELTEQMVNSDSPPLRSDGLALDAAVGFLPTLDAREPEVHPLERHMGRWFEGSGDWRTPNPDYDAADGNDGVVEYSVTWAWDEFRQSMRGELAGVHPDGSRTKFWDLYAFYNPLTREVLYLQIGRSGAYIEGRSPVRAEPLEFGETESLVTTMFQPDGSRITARHDNVFHGDGTHTADVFVLEDGEWQPARSWHWTLAP